MQNYEIIKESDFLKARRQATLAKNSNKKVIFVGRDDELNRKVLEKISVDILLIELSERKDFQKQRNSGFNQVLARIAKKNNITLGISLDELIESSKNEKIKILSRISQNVKLCNKNKIQMNFINLNDKNGRNIQDLRSLGLVLGMPTWMTKKL